LGPTGAAGGVAPNLKLFGGSCPCWPSSRRDTHPPHLRGHRKADPSLPFSASRGHAPERPSRSRPNKPVWRTASSDRPVSSTRRQRRGGWSYQARRGEKAEKKQCQGRGPSTRTRPPISVRFDPSVSSCYARRSSGSTPNFSAWFHSSSSRPSGGLYLLPNIVPIRGHGLHLGISFNLVCHRHLLF